MVNLTCFAQAARRRPTQNNGSQRPAIETEVSKVGRQQKVNGMGLLYLYYNSPLVARAFALS